VVSDDDIDSTVLVGELIVTLLASSVVCSFDVESELGIELFSILFDVDSVRIIILDVASEVVATLLSAIFDVKAEPIVTFPVLIVIDNVGVVLNSVVRLLIVIADCELVVVKFRSAAIGVIG